MRMRLSVAAVVVGGALAGPATAEAAEAALGREVVVRVYDGAGLTEAMLRPALRVAADALAPAWIDVRWAACATASGRSAICQRPIARGERVLRLVQGPAAKGPVRRLALGDALVDRGGSSAFATIYVDRVARLAAAAGADIRALLGYAIAHELGHLLLASSAHAEHGLMRALWSGDELRRARPADWTFTATEIAALRATYK